MGNSHSEKVSESESMASRKMWHEAASSMKNMPSLHFHKVYGTNIALKNDNTVAYRYHSFNYGITFTDRPVNEYEPIFLKIRETSTNWSGAIRIGFTANDPSEIDKSKLPAHSCPDFAARPGNWAKALPESLNKINSLLAFYVDAVGNVYYKLDNEKEVYLMGGIDTCGKLWGVIDVYGNTLSVELVPNPKREEPSVEPGLEIPPYNFDLAFHELHGSTAVLSDDNTVARRKGVHYSYVFTSMPLNLDEKYVIKISGIDPVITGPIEYGVTSCNPSNMSAESLPSNTEDLLDLADFWVVKRDSCNYRCGDLLLFSVSSDGQFLVMKNGKSTSSKLCVDTSVPLWLYIKLSGSVDEINMMGSLPTENFLDMLSDFEDLSLICRADCASRDEKKSEDKENGSDCIICSDKPRNCILYKCGHMCLCFECAQSYFKPGNSTLCPICRQPIQDIVKVYT